MKKIPYGFLAASPDYHVPRYPAADVYGDSDLVAFVMAKQLSEKI